MLDLEPSYYLQLQIIHTNACSPIVLGCFASPIAIMSQLTFENSGELIRTTTFVVLDCETTGVDSVNGSMTELAAIKICGGEVLGTFQTLINPGQHVDARIVSLTGITNEELRDAPPVEVILPSFWNFLAMPSSLDTMFDSTLDF